MIKKLLIILIALLLSGEGWALDKGNLVNQWRDYEAGKLTAPAIVQVDYTGKEYMIWVWDGASIQGPFSRPGYDEKEITATAAAIAAQPKVEQIDSRDTEITALKTQVVTLTAANAKLTADLATAKAEVTKEVVK